MIKKLSATDSIHFYFNDTEYLSIADPRRLKITNKYFSKKLILIDRDGVLNLKNDKHRYVRNFKELKINYSFLENYKKNLRNKLIICITNPLDVIVMALQKYSGLPQNKIVGMAGILDSSRFIYFLSQELNVPVKKIKSFVLGGHGDSMVAMTGSTEIENKKISELIKEGKITQERLNEIIDRTKKGGAEIVKYLEKGSAFYAPAASGVELAESYLKDLKKQ